jgi:uncharacterized protein with gpF-like domain
LALRIPIPYRRTLEAHRGRLDRLIDKRSIVGLRRVYRDAQASLVAKLSKVGRHADTFTAHQHRAMLLQARQGVKLMQKRMAGEMGQVSIEAASEGLHSLASEVSALEREFTGADIALPIDEAGRFQGIISGQRESMLRLHEESLANYGAAAVRKIEDQLTTSLMTGETMGDAMDRLVDVLDGNEYKAEEIARTETAFAFNAASAAGIAECADELPGLMMRWTEYVDEETGEALDDRVAEDSLSMHGQVVAPGGRFVMPRTLPDGTELSKRSHHLLGRTWEYPPNRPNDRSTIVPWRKEWSDLPGWQWKNGRRVEL